MKLSRSGSIAVVSKRSENLSNCKNNVLKNGINICQKHHCSIHMSDSPTLNNQIIEIKGLEWAEELETIKRNTFVKTSLEYYNTIIKNLSTIYNID